MLIQKLACFIQLFKFIVNMSISHIRIIIIEVSIKSILQISSHKICRQLNDVFLYIMS